MTLKKETDEIKDAVLKLKSINKKDDDVIKLGENLQVELLTNSSFKNLSQVENFLREIPSLFMKDMV